VGAHLFYRPLNQRGLLDPIKLPYDTHFFLKAGF